ncbi:MAG TPA: hypothetical protein VLA79_03620 [Polyangia bacterium]|nr:hypothetical protein [Polyangia bacterium]
MTAISLGRSDVADYDNHQNMSRDAQRRADKWMLSGAVLMTTAILGPIGFPLFLKGMSVQRKAQIAGLSVRPMICTLLGYLVIMDSGLNSIGWSLDLFAHHSLVTRALVTAWGNMFDSGYFWHYNELWIGGAGAPGEKSWEFALVPTCFSMRLAAAIGFLKMKRWGHQWLIVTCWFGVIYWVGYVANMTIFADLRYNHTVFPWYGWWIYDIFYITPFLAIPYLHTVNREIFSD